MAQANGILSELRADARGLVRRAWWVFLIGGIAAVVFGLLAFAKPVAAWLVVATFFAASILVEGVASVVGSLKNRRNDGWWILLLIGVLGIAVGGYALLHPLVSMAAFVFLVALQAMLFGIFLLMLGFKVRAATEREWILYLAGGLSLLFGILAFVNPGLGGLSVIWTIATWAIVTGVLRIVFAFKAKALPEKIRNHRAAA